MTDPIELTERVVAAIGRLVARGQIIDDEWTYVHDLETVWVARLRAVAAEQADAPGVPFAELETAIDRLVTEADLVSDPHRAIDWLSTLPQATLVAFGEGTW